MSTWTHFIFIWLADYYALATAILLLALLAGALVRQPIKRYSVSASAVVGLIVLAILSAAPFWPRLVFIGKSNPATRERPIDQFATVNASPIELKTPIGTTRPMVSSAKPQAKAGPPAVHSPSPPIDPDVQTAPSRQIDYAELATAAFITGAGIVSIWLTIGALRIRRLCRLAERPPKFAIDELNTISLSLRERAGVRGCRIPQLLVSRLIDVAAACGLLRPTILLPSNAVREAATGSSSHIVQHSSFASSLRMLLAHEWAHIRRGDLWLLAASRLLLVVLFAHPLYWLLRRRLRFDQELLADTEAAAICGRQEYAETLFAWARRLPARRFTPAGALGMWNRPGQLSRRIAMLLDERIRPQVACSRLWKVTTTTSMMFFITGLSLLTVRPSPEAAADTPEVAKAEITPAVQPHAAKQSASVEPQKSATDQNENVSIIGTCVDEHQKPIPNAHVRMFRIDHSSSPLNFPEARINLAVNPSLGEQPTASQLLYCSDYYDPASQRVLQETHTDEKGQFHFADLTVDKGWRDGSDSIFIFAQAPGRASTSFSTTINRNNDKAPLTITMLKPGIVRGRVTNTAGQPVAGAFVWKPGVVYKPVPGNACAVTDADGRYELNDLQPFDAAEVPPQMTSYAIVTTVSLLVSVQHPDYADGIIEYSRLPAQVDVTLQPAATLRGQLFLDDGHEPARKASLEVILDDGTSRYVPVNETGGYSISQLPPGPRHVRAWTLDRPSTSRSIDLHAGENVLELRLPKGGTIKGHIVDVATGKTPVLDPRIGGISLGASIAGHDPRASCQGYMSNEGTFSMVVQPGKNLIGLFNPYWKLVDEEQWKTKGVEVAAGQTVEIELKLAAQVPAPPPLPKEPLGEKAVINALKFNGGGVNTETVDGQEYVTDIYTIGCDETGVRAPELPPISWLEKNVLLNVKKFPKLRTLGLANPDGGDAALVPLRGVESLETLCIGGAPAVANQSLTSDLTMDAFDHFATLPNLKMLYVMSPHFDDRAFGYLDRWPKLEGLMLGGSFTSEGVKQLRGHSKLKQLGIVAMANAKLGDDCLDEIGALTNLENLGLCDADEVNPSHWTVTDDGMKKLAGLTKLSSLTLQCPQITNAGLVHLRELKNLTHLDLKDASVTQEGIGELKKSLPKLNATGYRGWKPAVPKSETKSDDVLPESTAGETPGDEAPQVTAKAGGAILAK